MQRRGGFRKQRIGSSRRRWWLNRLCRGVSDVKKHGHNQRGG